MKKLAKRSAKPATRDPARTRDALLDAAFQEMHRAGFRGADLESILAKAGVTKGAMYHHFENKEALGYAVVDEVIAGTVREKWQAPLEGAERPLDALIDIVRGTSLKAQHIANGCPLNNIAQEMSPLDEGFRRRVGRLFDLWHRAVANALRQAQARGQVRRDVKPEESATFLIAAYEGFMSLGKCHRDLDAFKAGQQALVGYLEQLRQKRARAA